MYPQSYLARFAQLWAGGATYSQIKKALGITQPTVSRWRKECGFPPRKPGPRKGVRKPE